jgi:Holliday junction resolvase RusA-like endonuclease
MTMDNDNPLGLDSPFGPGEYTGKSLCLRLPIPPSSNNIYVTSKRGHRFLSKKGREYKTIIIDTVRNAALEEGFAIGLKNYFVRLFMQFHLPILFKNGEIRIFDISNRIKVLEDAIMDGLEMDDRQCTEITVCKVDSSEDDRRVDITFTVLDEVHTVGGPRPKGSSRSRSKGKRATPDDRDFLSDMIGRSVGKDWAG